MKFTNWKNQYIDAAASKPDYILALEGNSVSPDQTKIFRAKVSSFQKTYCEIGSGSGGHLIEQAKQNPANLYIGFELRFKRTYRTAEKAEKEGLKNIYVVRGSALEMSTLLGEIKIDGIFINFPDPWSKKKWKKHRILSPENLKNFTLLLKDNGSLFYKTDHKEYFEETTEIIKNCDFLHLEWLTEDLWNSEHNETNVATEFEMLFRSKKMPIYALKSNKAK